MLHDLASASPRTLITLSASVAAVGVIVQDLELLSSRRNLRPGGPFAWEILQARLAWTSSGFSAAVLRRMFTSLGTSIILCTQLACALALVVVRDMAPLTVLVLLVLLCHLLLRSRYQFGLNGADAMQLVVFVGAAAFVVAPTSAARTAALVFIGAEALLAYVAAGWAKVLSPPWRSGRAVAGIMSTRQYGSSDAADFFRRHPNASPILSWATLLFECAGPVLVFAGPLGFVTFAALGIVFHLGIGLALGLNDFVWAFAATYPALLYLSQHASFAQPILSYHGV